jgi:hypothetical protein
LQQLSATRREFCCQIQNGDGIMRAEDCASAARLLPTSEALCNTAPAMQCNVPTSGDRAAAVREVNERTVALDGKRREHYGRFSKCGGVDE